MQQPRARSTARLPVALAWTAGWWSLDWFRLGWNWTRLANVAFQSGNPQVEPFDLFEGDQVYFTQQFDDSGLAWVHKRIMAVVGLGDGRSRPGPY